MVDDRNTPLDFFDDIVTVTHVDAAAPNGIGIDGVDRLTHMERLRFNDQSFVLVPGLNAEPVGLLTIVDNVTGLADTTPQVGQVLRVSTASVTDGDNVVPVTNVTGAITGAPITFVWQVETIPGTNIYEDIVIATGLGDLQATGSTFTVTADFVGLRLRVSALYLDGHDVLETVNSAATTAVEVPAAPVITSNGGGAAAAITINENIALAATVTATDANVGDVVAFSIIGGADAAEFLIELGHRRA